MSSENRSFSSLLMYFIFFFFFSSRRRHTRLQGDWSSDVCSSDLHHLERPGRQELPHVGACHQLGQEGAHLVHLGEALERSEERRVGKECRSRWSPYH